MKKLIRLVDLRTNHQKSDKGNHQFFFFGHGKLRCFILKIFFSENMSWQIFFQKFHQKYFLIFS